MPTPWTDSLFLCPQDGSSGSHEVAMPCASRRRAGVCPLTPSVARRTGVIRTPRFPGDHVRQQWGRLDATAVHSPGQLAAPGCGQVPALGQPGPPRPALGPLHPLSNLLPEPTHLPSPSPVAVWPTQLIRGGRVWPSAILWQVAGSSASAGAKWTETGFPQAASSSQWRGFGVGEQAAPWPPAWRWAAGSAWPLAPRCTALRPERWPAALGACTPLLRAEGLRAPAEGVQQGQCLPAAPQLFLDVLPGSFLRSRGRERFPPATEVRALSSLCTSFLP